MGYGIWDMAYLTFLRTAIEKIATCTSGSFKLSTQADRCNELVIKKLGKWETQWL